MSLLFQNGRMVGYVLVEAPPGASGQQLIAPDISTPAAAPVTGVPTARLRALFQAGSMPGEYRILVELFGGNRIELFVRAR